MVQPRFNFGSTSKTLNVSLLPFNERSEFQNLAFQVKTPSFFYYYNFFFGCSARLSLFKEKIWVVETRFSFVDIYRLNFEVKDIARYLNIAHFLHSPYFFGILIHGMEPSLSSMRWKNT